MNKGVSMDSREEEISKLKNKKIDWYIQFLNISIVMLLIIDVKLAYILFRELPI